MPLGLLDITYCYCEVIVQTDSTPELGRTYSNKYSSEGQRLTTREERVQVVSLRL